jgi:carbon-monoxide dehydrogenase small subunit
VRILHARLRRVGDRLPGPPPDPGDDEIREALSGNICRCTGYQGIIRAVRRAAANLAGAGS